MPLSVPTGNLLRIRSPPSPKRVGSPSPHGQQQQQQPPQHPVRLASPPRGASAIVAGGVGGQSVTNLGASATAVSPIQVQKESNNHHGQPKRAPTPLGQGGSTTPHAGVPTPPKPMGPFRQPSQPMPLPSQQQVSAQTAPTMQPKQLQLSPPTQQLQQCQQGASEARLPRPPSPVLRAAKDAPQVRSSPQLTQTSQLESNSNAPTNSVAGHSTPRDVSSPRGELRAGSWAHIGDCLCQVGSPLGMGSYGVVWAAEAEGCPKLAIKEIVCSSHADLLNALFEGHLLRMFRVQAGLTSAVPREGSTGCSYGSGDDDETDNPMPPSGASQGLIPSLVASETVHLGPERWRVRLAMTRISGEPLDTFLDRRLQRWDLSNVEISPALLCEHFKEACQYSHELLSQLAPAFRLFCVFVYHRDVNTHNILIKPGEANRPRFGLVDFGLAVDALCWQREEGTSWTMSRPSRIGQDGACTWHHLDVGGDCRYWPTSAWVQFMWGWKELEARPALCFEYQTLLDPHALGMTALQLVAEMLPPVPEVRRHEPVPTSGSMAHVTASITALRHAWDGYWGTVSPLHDALMDTFHNGGDWDELKIACMERSVHTAVLDHLRELRVAVQHAKDACMMAPQELGLGGAHALFATLLLLISLGDQPSSERLQGPRLWKEVTLLLGGNCGASPGTLNRSPG